MSKQRSDVWPHLIFNKCYNLKHMRSTLRLVVLMLLLCSGVNSLLAQTFKISPSGKYTACSGDSVKIEAVSGFAKYKWNTGSTNRIIYVVKSATYVCEAQDSRGNTYKDSVYVNFVSGQKPTITMSPSTGVICKGDSLVIEASKGFSAYKWSTGATTNRIVLRPTTSGYVTLTTKDNNGCLSTKTVQYSVKSCSTNKCDNLIGVWPKAHLCNDHDSVFLEAKSGFKTYVWRDSVSGQNRMITDDGWYVLTATDSNGHSCTDSVKITKGSKTMTVTLYPSHVICPGQSVVASISGNYDTIWWSGVGKGTNSQTFKPTKTTSYVVEAVDKYGCSKRAEFKITVKDTCTGCEDLISASKKSLCHSKDSVVLEAKSGFIKYLWSTKSHDRKIVVKYSGWFVLAVMKSDSTMCYDSIYIGQGGKTIEISSNPQNAIVCEGDSIALEATRGFKTYSWNVNGVKHGNGIKFKPTASIKVIVEAVDEHGCSSKAYIYVTVKQCSKCPKIIEPWPSHSLCKRDSLVLEAKNGYKDYKWSTGLSGRILWVKKAGWYWLDFKDSSGNACRDSVYITSESPKNLTITVYPARKVCIGDTIKFIASEGFKTYSWNTGSKDRYFYHVAQKNKEIVLEAVDSNGCTKRVVYKLVVDSCKHSGVNEAAVHSILVYPNPTNSTCNISLREGQILAVNVFDMYGRLVWTATPADAEYKLDLSRLAVGTYILNVHSTQGSSNHTISRIE